MITITVRYTCGICDVVDAEVPIIARLNEEDLVEWMNKLTLAISQDHARRSPFCHPRKLKHVMIPTQNSGWVGGPPLQ